MIRVAIKTIVFALVVAGIYPGGQTARRVRTQRNRPPTIHSFRSSLPKVDFCPYVQGGVCSASGPGVRLEVEATDPENDKLKYNYSVSAGVVTGAGRAVIWDLDKAPPGIQTATVKVEDQHGGRTSGTVQVNVVVCGACDPPCPTISVTCPTQVIQGDLAVFVANVGAEDPDGRLRYLWRHSNGRRGAGQVGPELRIEALGLPGDVITATVNVQGLDPSCQHLASCSTRIVKRND